MAFILQTGAPSNIIDQSFYQSIGIFFSIISDIHKIHEESDWDNKIVLYNYRPENQIELKQLVKLKNTYFKIPIIMMSENTDEYVLHWSIRNKVWNFISLPEEIDLLSESIQRLSLVLQKRETGNTREILFPKSVTENEPLQKNKSTTQKAIDYISKKYSDKITLDELAEMCNMSVASFTRKFRAEQGVNSKEYINQFRINMAKDILIEYEVSIDETAYLTGFSDASHFIRNFKKSVGLTPASFRDDIFRKS